jgi:hypothetical protein
MYTSSSCKPNLVVSILTVQNLVFGLPLPVLIVISPSVPKIITSALEAGYSYTISSCNPNLVASIHIVQELFVGLPI